jgi:hypothetical protein
VAQVLIAFVLLFYVPTLFFRFTASRNVDLSRRKISNQIEDFFAAALPSVMLNAITWFLVNTVTLWKLLEVSAMLPVLLTPGSADFLQHNLLLINSYYLSLLAVSGFSGWIYGYVENRSTRFGVSVLRSLPSERWKFALLWHRLWATFFDAEKVMLFPFALQPTFVFVRTDRLYHGRLHRYDRTSDGEIAGITLGDVHRFSLKSRDECLATNDDFATPLGGTLWVRWSTITDINIADVGQPKTFDSVMKVYAADRAKALAARQRRGFIARFLRLR